MSTDHADLNLLFGVLALQADLLDAARFAEACTAWSARKETPLADLLVERGWLTPEDRADVQRLLERKLKKHSGDAHASLAAVTNAEAREALAELDDADVQRSLAGLPPGPGRVLLATAAYQPESRQRYTLTHVHAKGGIGQVWLAHDGDLGRDVALKEVRLERADHPDIRARFLEEARITGQLEHPGIVPVYELARRPDTGQPFYTMRFVRGRTLTEAGKAYHKRLRAGEAGPLELRALLGAFVAVCNAVAYAHSRGVIHRDLKGQNVVLGDFGEVIVLDWGLAKVLDRAEGEAPPVTLEPDATRGFTVQGQVFGTPAYMSPEQADGRPVDVRGDVYGLGAILYEILAGRPPFVGESTQEVLRQVRQERPAPPRDLVPSAPLPLQAVCLKALAKRPADRYASPRELAQEVEHFLADEPVSAYREALPARAARWGRRHRPLVTAAAALLLAAVVALTAGTVLLGRANARTEQQRALAEEQREEARRQRDLANANFQKARRAVDDYLTQVSESRLLKSPLPGLQPLRKELLETALQYYQDFARQHRDDPALQEDLAQALFRVGKISAEIGSKEDALKSFREARDIWQALLAEQPDEARHRRGRARSSLEIGRLETHALGDLAAARGALEEARAAFEELSAQAPDDEEAQNDLARSYEFLSSWYHQSHEPAGELDSLQKALALRQRMARANRKYERDVASQSMNLGYYDTRRGKAADALRYHEQAKEVLEKLVADKPADNEARAELRRVYTNIAYVHFLQTRRLDQADRYFRLALAQAERLTRDNPSVTEYQLQRAGAYNLLADLLTARADPAGAEKLIRQAIAALEPLHKDDPKNQDTLFGLGRGYHQLGRVLTLMVRFPEAAEALAKGRDLTRAVMDASPDNKEYPIYLAQVYRDTAMLQRLTRQPAEALRSLQQAAALGERVARDPGATLEDRGQLATIYRDTADLHRSAGRNAEAATFYRKALDLRREILAANPANNLQRPRLGQDSLALAETLVADRKPDEAIPVLRQACDLMDGPGPSSLADLHLRALTHALLSRLLGAAKTAEAQAEAQRHADQAMAFLQEFAARAGTPILPELQKSPNLESLRDRPDFRKLVAGLEEKAKAEREERQRFERAQRLLTEGNHAAAVELARTAAEDKQATHITVYNSACICSLASAAARRDEKLPAADREKVAEQYAGRALALLEEAARKGYRTKREVDHMKIDKDLDPLRGRADFRKLLAGLEQGAAAAEAK